MKKRTESIMGMAFFGPALVLLTIFLFLPMILTLIFSFTDFFALNPGLTHFVGLDNYIQIFKDDVFSQAFFNTVKFVIIIVPLQGIGALVLALLINKVTHCKKYFKVAFFVPVVMSLAVVSTLWIQIYSPEGIMNAILSFFGIDAQPFINSASQALPSIAIMSAWQGMGYQMIIFLGGLQNINPALYEAAEMDGAGRIKKIIHVTIPALAPIITVMFIMESGKILNDSFEQVYNFLTPSTYAVGDVISTFVYRMGIQKMQYSFTTAVDLFKNIISFMLVVMTNYIARKTNDYALW